MHDKPTPPPSEPSYPPDLERFQASFSRCPYCHLQVGPLGSVACADCLGRHHPDCWQEAGECSVCRGTVYLAPPAHDPLDGKLAGSLSRGPKSLLFLIPFALAMIPLQLNVALGLFEDAWATVAIVLLALGAVITAILGASKPGSARVRDGVLRFRRGLRAVQVPLNEVREVAADGGWVSTAAEPRVDLSGLSEPMLRLLREAARTNQRRERVRG